MSAAEWRATRRCWPGSRRPTNGRGCRWRRCNNASGCRPIARCHRNALINTTCRSMTTSLSSVPRPQAAEAALPILLRQLRLARISSHWQSLASQAEAEGWSHSQFLYALCEQEVEQRQQARQQRLLLAAQLPCGKALADYDHSGRIEAGPWQELEGLTHQSDWLQRGENVLLFGPSCVGKTHLAIGIVLAQIGLDQPCRFYQATALVQELQKARAEYNLPQALERLDRYPLLLIDDIGYVRRD